ncbi:MAG: ferrochelatase [Rickettsiales bacterium]|nr:ferrochelatase [Rickettsiales bacterium]
MSVVQKHSKTAIILFNLGGPDKIENVKPFLFNLFNDPAIIGAPKLIRWCLAKFISSKRESTAQEIYSHIGGYSPIVENSEKQARALEAQLAPSGEAKTFICMRYWHPMSDEVAKQVKDYAPDHIILLPLYPQFSTTTSGSSIKDWHEAAKRAELDVETTTLCCYPTQEDYIHSQTNIIRSHFEKVKDQNPRILFSAHGLPEKIIEAGDPYQKQIEATTQAVIKELAIENLDYVNCYQSRVGPLKWIGPSTEDEIERAGKDSKSIVLVPIAFVSEHSETLVELDIEYKELADHAGVKNYIRVPTVMDDPDFIKGLANLCLSVGTEGFYCPWDDGKDCVKDESLTTPFLTSLENKEEKAA